MSATLVPLGEGQPYRIERPVTLVGRRKFVCSLFLHDRRISQLHCVIQRTDDGDLVLRDLGSTNGTRVNGRKVTEGVLMPGDELTFAAERFRLEVEGAVSSANANEDYVPGAKDTLPDPLAERNQKGTDHSPLAQIASDLLSEKSSDFGDPSPPPEAMESSMQSLADPISIDKADSEPAPRKVESLKEAEKLGDRAPYTTLQARSAEEFRSFLHDDSEEEGDDEAQTEIIRSADSPFGGLVEWSEFPKTLSKEASLSDRVCGQCEGSRLVKAPYSFWQLPLKLLNMGVYCCPCCYRREIHGNES